MTLDCAKRRQFIKGFGGIMAASLGCAALPVSASLKTAQKSSSDIISSASDERSLSFYNRHTGESHRASFWQDGRYQAQALSEFDKVLRDHRQNEVSPMDPRLFDLLYALQEKLDVKGNIDVISAYRSPRTNAMLAAQSGAVAKKSFHMRGMAMDIAIPGVDLRHLRNAAQSLALGGVGFYERSGFVHVDTARVRSW